MSFSPPRGALVALAVLALHAIDAVPAPAVSLDVPNTHPTLQSAVATAALSVDVDNVITISSSPVLTSSTIGVGAAFTAARRLTIRPAANLIRATIANDNPVVPVFDMASAGYVTLQDLDILRNVTNGDHIISILTCDNILIERCRIGSNWSTTGTAGWANVFMLYPTEVILRNNILFANTPGTFDYGINAGSFNDPINSLRLYNNVVSDYAVYGIRIEAVAPGALVLLRNNVCANQATLIPEPFAYRTDVVPGPTVVTSHNVAFSSAPLVQSGVGQDVAGVGAGLEFLSFLKGVAALSFVTTDWNMVFDANPDYYRLVDLGPLHDDAGDYGMTVLSAFPDIEVVDDVELDYRPGGVVLHSDRGADQLEPGTGNGTGVGQLPPPWTGLHATVRGNPARSVSIAYGTRLGGQLAFEVFDAGGRLLHRTARAVDAESAGAFEWQGPRPTGVLFYRLRLERSDGGVEEAAGRIVIVR